MMRVSPCSRLLGCSLSNRLGALLIAALPLCGWTQQVVPPRQTGHAPATVDPRPEHPESASGRSAKPVLRTRTFMAVTAHPLASGAAADLLESGGSAVDAAIAAQMMLTLVEPQSSGIGGGGFLLHYDPGQNATAAYDGRETAPAGVDETLFLRSDGRAMGFHEAVVGGRSVGVPGLVSMLALAHAAHGRLPWADLFEPAIRQAREGFTISPRLHALLAREPFLRQDEPARRYFYDDSGAPLPVGHRLRNPALADTLESIAQRGAEAFYQGPIARDIVAAVREHARNPGQLSLEDLRDYRAPRRPALCTPHQRWTLCGMPAPSAGAITVAQILALHSAARTGPLFHGGAPDAQAVHRFSQAARLAFADRDRYIADPAFVSVPTAGLLAPSYLAARATLITDRSLGQAPPGDPVSGNPVRAAAGAIEAERPATTHLSIVDTEGRVVSMTSSVEDAFGSRLMVRGFLLNNQLTDFSWSSEAGAERPANRVEPGKRPRSSMAPTLVFGPQPSSPATDDSSHRPFLLAIGSPGGASIINYVARTLVGVLNDQQPLQQVIDQPNLGSRNGPTDLEAGTTPEALQQALRARGHVLRMTAMTSGLHGIMRVCAPAPGAAQADCRYESGADPRREGIARGR